MLRGESVAPADHIRQERPVLPLQSLEQREAVFHFLQPGW